MSSNSSNSSSSYRCYDCKLSFIIFTAYSVATILVLLPPCVLVLSLGVRRWRGWDSTTGSHSDVFTYHMAVMEMTGFVGSVFQYFAVVLQKPFWMNVTVYLAVASTNGHVPFHILTCVERHLAVVHPITYMRLKNRGGVLIRNVIIASVWLLFFTWFGLTAKSVILEPYFCVTTFSMVVVTFCSFSVLRALIRPGPGQGGGDKGRVDQSKKRAFNTIMAIMLALWVRFGGQMLFLVVFVSMDAGGCLECTLLTSVVWLCIPSSLVLPMLYLHRAGKLTCCKKTESEQSRG